MLILFQDYIDVFFFIFIYFLLIKEFLSKGEIFKEWDKFVEEIVYFILLRFVKFESRGMYVDFGRMMYQCYFCIGYNVFGDLWVIYIYLCYVLNYLYILFKYFILIIKFVIQGYFNKKFL